MAQLWLEKEVSACCPQLMQLLGLLPAPATAISGPVRGSGPVVAVSYSGWALPCAHRLHPAAMPAVYRVPPASTVGHRAELWDVNKVGRWCCLVKNVVASWQGLLGSPCCALRATTPLPSLPYMRPCLFCKLRGVCTLVPPSRHLQWLAAVSLRVVQADDDAIVRLLDEKTGQQPGAWVCSPACVCTCVCRLYAVATRCRTPRCRTM